jgi:hypothetical protein
MADPDNNSIKATDDDLVEKIRARINDVETIIEAMKSKLPGENITDK